MSTIRVSSEKVIEAAPHTIYAVLSDYSEQRPRILPRNFLDYTVEKGGQGGGTEVRYRLQAARRQRPYHVRVSEPVKGQVLAERDLNSSLVTTWTLTPLEDGRTSVHIASEWQGGQGMGGFFERTFAPLGLRAIYNTMLRSLERVVRPASEQDEGRTDMVRKLGVVALGVAVAAGLSFGLVLLRRGRKPSAE